MFAIPRVGIAFVGFGDQATRSRRPVEGSATEARSRADSATGQAVAIGQEARWSKGSPAALPQVAGEGARHRNGPIRADALFELRSCVARRSAASRPAADDPPDVRIAEAVDRRDAVRRSHADLPRLPDGDASCDPRERPHRHPRPETRGDDPVSIGRAGPEQTRHRGDARNGLRTADQPGHDREPGAEGGDGLGTDLSGDSPRGDRRAGERVRRDRLEREREETLPVGGGDGEGGALPHPSATQRDRPRRPDPVEVRHCRQRPLDNLQPVAARPPAVVLGSRESELDKTDRDDPGGEVLARPLDVRE